jgi:hypothetical protein
VPVIAAALGTIKNGLDQKIQSLPGHRSATELQEVTVMSNANCIRLSAGVNRFDLLLRAGLSWKQPPDN